MTGPHWLLTTCFFAGLCLAAAAAPQPVAKASPVLVQQGEDVMIESFGARRIVRRGDTSYIGYSQSIDGKWHIRVRAFNHDTGALGEPVDISPGTDNHSIMGLVADSQGRLHCVSGGHGPLTYVRSLRGDDISHWTPPRQIATEGTYAMLMIDRKDRMYVFYRHKGSHLAMQTCPPDGDWQPTRIIGTAGSGLVFYIMGVAMGHETGQQSLHVAGHFYGDPAAYGRDWPKEAYGYRVRPWYIRSPDGGDTWQTAGGKTLDLPVSERTVDVPFDLEEPYDIPWSVDVTVDDEGRPHVFCAWSYRKPGPDLSYRGVQGAIGKLPGHLWELTWDQGEWSSKPVVTPGLAGAHLYHSAAIFAEGTLHIAVTAYPIADAGAAATQPTQLMHLWAGHGEDWQERLVAHNATFTNNWKLPDSSGVLELLWRGRAPEGGAKAAIYYTRGLATP